MNPLPGDEIFDAVSSVRHVRAKSTADATEEFDPNTASASRTLHKLRCDADAERCANENVPNVPNAPNAPNAHPVMMAVIVVRYAAASYPSSIRSSGTTVVASDFVSNWPVSASSTKRGMSRSGLQPPA